MTSLFTVLKYKYLHTEFPFKQIIFLSIQTKCLNKRCVLLGSSHDSCRHVRQSDIPSYTHTVLPPTGTMSHTHNVLELQCFIVLQMLLLPLCLNVCFYMSHHHCQDLENKSLIYIYCCEMTTIIVKAITKSNQGLLCARHCAKCSACIGSVKPLNDHLVYEP